MSCGRFLVHGGDEIPGKVGDVSIRVAVPPNQDALEFARAFWDAMSEETKRSEWALNMRKSLEDYASTLCAQAAALPVRVEERQILHDICSALNAAQEATACEGGRLVRISCVGF